MEFLLHHRQSAQEVISRWHDFYGEILGADYHDILQILSRNRDNLRPDIRENPNFQQWWLHFNMLQPHIGALPNLDMITTCMPIIVHSIFCNLFLWFHSKWNLNFDLEILHTNEEWVQNVYQMIISNIQLYYCVAASGGVFCFIDLYRNLFRTDNLGRRW